MDADAYAAEAVRRGGSAKGVNWDALTPPAGPMSEKVFMQAIIDHARRHGWAVYHTYDSRRSESGFPDLVLVRGYVLWLECKTETGQPTAEQLSWGELLLLAGQDYRLVRPSDWSEIVKTLEAR